MRNLLGDGKFLNVPCSYPAVPVSGDPVRYGMLTGVAVTTEAEGGNAAGETSIRTCGGVYLLAVEASAGAIAVGDSIFFQDAAQKLNNTSTGYFFGFALEVVAAGVVTIKVLHVQSPGSGTLGAGVIGTAHFAALAVDTAALGNLQVTAGKIAADAVTTAKILDANVTSPKMAETLLRYAEVAISSANIVGVEAGQFGHANGVELLAAPAAGKVHELVSGVLVYDYDTAAYTGGGNITINWVGGAAITGLVSAANSVGAAADKVVQLVPLAAAGNAMVVASAINLVTSGAFTQPGTAAGVVRIKVSYRVHTTGLA